MIFSEPYLKFYAKYSLIILKMSKSKVTRLKYVILRGYTLNAMTTPKNCKCAGFIRSIADNKASPVTILRIKSYSMAYKITLCKFSN